MIREVLTLIRDGGILSKADIAYKMGIQEPTLDSIFSLLSSKGYLKKVNGNKETSKRCNRCSGCTGCTTITSVSTLYTITDKGKNYLNPK